MTPVKARMDDRALASLAAKILALVNAVRHEAGESRITSLPRGSLQAADRECPVAKALDALLLPDERRVVFGYAWYAAAASKVWNVAFADTLLMSVTMPATLRDFTLAFRRGLYPELIL